MERQRLQWLDALRGLTMTLVVSWHVAMFSFEEDVWQSPMIFVELMRMPAFFFVSGFLAYNMRFDWTMPNALRLTWKKIRVQVIPAFVFLCVYVVLRKTDFRHTFMLYIMHDEYKGGYWFTWVLLHMFVIYYMVCLAARNRHWPVWVLWLVSSVVYEKYGRTAFNHYLLHNTSFTLTLKFLPFFLFGNLTHRHWQKAQWLMDTPWFFPIVAALAFLCCADTLIWHSLRNLWADLPRTLGMYLLVTLLVIFFRHHEAWFTRDKVIGRGLQYIGTRTLDVYLLHYILLPVMPAVGVWLDNNRPNFVIDTTLSVGVGLVVIGFCLLISNILRISPFLSLHLFGKK